MIRSLVLATVLAIGGAGSSAADFQDVGIAWRPFGGEAFREAEAAGRPVFLVLTAPWTWDHFLLPERVFADEEVQARLEGGWVPVLADASTWPELRPLYSIPSGLLPSFHFLDADGVPFASSAPSGPEELAFRLREWVDPARRPPVEVVAAPPTVEMNAAKLANRAARWLSELSERGEFPAAPPHRDLDVGALLFLAEAGRTNIPRHSALALAREIGGLRGGPLIDRVDGGFHRAYAIPDTLPHFEKLLRPNAEMGRLLCAQFTRTASPDVGRDALLVLRFLNERLRVGKDPLYAESLAADLYDPHRRELSMQGREYYGLGAAGRLAAGVPPASAVLPVGGNFRAMQAFAAYATVFRDPRLVEAVRLAAPRLLGEGLEADGRARRVLGEAGVGNLLDQADTGAGLLALHALTGSPEALHAAERIAARLLDDFRTGTRGVFRSVARDADVPPQVRDAPCDAAWNGEALRFLVELGAVTRTKRWVETAREGIATWSRRIPADGRGLGALGGAAYRLRTPPPVILVVGRSGSPEAERLLTLALSVGDPWMRIRWVDPDDAKAVGSRFGMTFEREPALYVVRGAPSGALRDADVLEAVWREAAARER